MLPNWISSAHPEASPDDVIDAVSKGIAAYEETWKRFFFDEWPKISSNLSSPPSASIEKLHSTSSDVKVSKKRVKPTLIAHIGIPSNRHANGAASFTSTSRDSDPFLNRSIKPESTTPELKQTRSSPSPSSLAMPSVKVAAENERRLASLAQFMVKSRKGHRGFLALCELLLAHLKTLHQIYAEDKMSAGAHFVSQQGEASPVPIENIDQLFSDLHMPVYFGIELLKTIFPRICKLTPTFILHLEANNCARRLCAKIFVKAAEKSRSSLNGRASLPRSDRPTEQGEQRDAFDTIAYADKRDSRNFSEQPVQHANQQKVRDMFLEYVRLAGSDFIAQSGLNGGKQALNKRRDLEFKVKEILKTLAPQNFSWFAELLVCQFDQMRRRTAAVIPANPAKLELLEERLTKSVEAGKPDIHASAVVQFMRLADSYRLHTNLTRHVQQCIDEIEKRIIEGRRSNFVEQVRRACHFGELLAALNSFEDEHDLEGLLAKLDESMAKGFALLRVPWAIAYIQSCKSQMVVDVLSSRLMSIAEYCSNQSELTRKDFILDLLISSSVLLDKNEVEPWTPPARPSRDISALNLLDLVDLDLTLDAESLLVPECSVYISLLNSLKAFRKPDAAPSPTRAINSKTDCIISEPHKYTRKIRPVQVSAESPVDAIPKADPAPLTGVEPQSESSRLQAQLRHWYWWQWLDMKDLVESVVRYAVAEVTRQPTFESDTERLEQLKTMIKASLPPLLPAILKEHEQSIRLAVALSIEKAEHLLKQSSNVI